MLAYYLLIGIPFVAFFICKTKPGKVFLSLFFMGLFVLLSCRAIEVGVDIANYKKMFQTSVTKSFTQIWEDDSIEPGYQIFSKIIFILKGDFRTLLIVLAVLSTLPYYFLYKSESKYAVLIMALFVAVFPFTMLFSGLRQVIAMALTVPAYFATKKKKLVKFLLIVWLAYFFHESALVVLVLYPIYHLKIKPSWLVWIVPMMVVVLLFNKPIFRLILPLLGDKYEERYSDITNTGAYTMFFLFILFMIFSFVAPDEQKVDSETRGLRNILLLVVCVQSFAMISTIFMRANYYFMMFIPLLLPRILERVRGKDKELMQYVTVGLSLFFIAYFLIKGYVGADILDVFPYVPMWS